MSNYLVKWEEQAEAGDIECVTEIAGCRMLQY